MKAMTYRILGGLGVLVCASITYADATDLQGYWRSIDDRTGESLSIVQFKKEANGTYNGAIQYRYPNALGIKITHCTKCPIPFKNKPLIGLDIFWGFQRDPKNPSNYINAKVVEPRSGNVYSGKGEVSVDGRRLKLRGYQGVSIFGRTQVWFRMTEEDAQKIIQRAS